MSCCRSASSAVIYPLLLLMLPQGGQCFLWLWCIRSRDAAGSLQEQCIYEPAQLNTFFCLLWHTAAAGVLIQLFSAISGVQSLTSLSWKHLQEVMSYFMTARCLMSCVYLMGPRVYPSHALTSHPGEAQLSTTTAPKPQ